MSFRLFLSFSLVSLVACGDVDEPLPHEADSGSIPTDDAGVVDDRGVVRDAASLADAGFDGDAGSFDDASVHDSGPLQSDTGVSPRDAGVRPRDTGVSPRDTGVRPRDTGVSPRDTGVRPRDIGVSPRDTGRTDAGQETNHCAAYATLRNQCSGCHGRQGGFSLGNGSPAAIRAAVLAPSNQARGMDYVTPNDTSDSYLWHKISGTHRGAGGRGGSMPPGASLNATQLNQIEAWINAGAPAARCP